MNKMEIGRKMVLVSMAAALTGAFGCATSLKQIEPEVVYTNPVDKVVHAKVVNIVEVKKDASFIKQLGGALVGEVIGSQIGGGSTPYIVGTAASFVGMDVVNAKYGKLVDRLELEVSKDESYKCLIYGHDFRVGDKVVASIKDGKVVSIMHQKTYDNHSK